jgi:HNH endonuclease
MSRNRGKKIAHFRRGATAVQQYIGTDKFYICPLCMQGFTEAAIDAGQLTIEHVPPKSLGGRGILLTCSECNTSSGHSLDAALHRRDEQRRFSETVLGNDASYRGPAKWEADGERLNVEIYRDGKFLTIAGDPRRNSSAVIERMMESRSLNGRLTSDIRYHRRRAAIGDLRTAYLAALALLGYRYAFHSVFNPIREQITKPDLKIMDRWWISLDPETPVARQIFEVATPHCVLVQFDRVAVFLPIPGSSDDLYEQLATISKSDRRMQIRGDLLGWPSGMELREDLFETSRLPPLFLRVEEESSV